MLIITLLRITGDKAITTADYCMTQAANAARQAEQCQSIGCFAYWLPVAWMWEVGMVIAYRLAKFINAILRKINKKP